MLWVFYYNKNKCGIAKVNLSREGEYKVMVIGRKSPLGTWCSESETWTQAQLLVSKSPTFSSFVVRNQDPMSYFRGTGLSCESM